MIPQHVDSTGSMQEPLNVPGLLLDARRLLNQLSQPVYRVYQRPQMSEKLDDIGSIRLTIRPRLLDPRRDCLDRRHMPIDQIQGDANGIRKISGQTVVRRLPPTRFSLILIWEAARIVDMRT